MRTTFAFASLLVAAQAFEMFNLTETYKQYTGADLPFHLPHNRAEVRQAMAKRSKEPLTHSQRTAYHEAHHNLIAQRQRLGLGKVGVAAGPKVEQQYAELNSWSGFVLNILGGMSYSKGSDSKCYNAAESWIIAQDTGTDILKKIYIPAYLSEFQIQIQDFVAISAALYVDCSIDKLFTTVTHLASDEGISEISSRVAGSYLFEIKDAQDAFGARGSGQYTSQESGYAYGRAISVLLNYSI